MAADRFTRSGGPIVEPSFAARMFTSAADDRLLEYSLINSKASPRPRQRKNSGTRKASSVIHCQLE
ncbi:hypothetical protein [Streptomyces sp. NPDC059176]|uniref:hypothetical protein n=1 Tax=unclassified Streptomyces TaxID=2593676 RepID=UPI00367F2F86